jgi:hypothetical protein
MPNARQVAAPHGQKTIELQVRLWTNEIGSGGKVLPRHAWDRGVVSTVPNDAHGISRFQVPFNSLAELPLAVEKLLVKAELRIHPSERLSKYLEA